MIYYKKIFINGLQVLGDNCPYYANLYNFMLDSSNTNNDSELYTDGSYSGLSKINSKTFTLVVSTKNDNDLMSALQLTHVIKSGDFKLIADIENLGEVECIVKKESITTDDFGVMTITLKMCNPYIYSKNYKEITLNKQISGGYKFPTSAFTIPTEWIYTENVVGNTGECINSGFATIHPEIIIEGEGSDFKIVNLTNNEELNISTSIKNGDILYIDCRPESREVKVNDINSIKYKTGSYISLITGSNELKIDYTGECSVTVKWREAWI